MDIRFTRKRDGTTVLHCTRPDGTSTGQRQRGGFFAQHDLMHYAVETTLGLRLGFFGMLMRGWDIDDFGTPWPRGPLPADAAEDASLAECLTGMFDYERVSGAPLTLDDLNAGLAAQFEQAGMTFRRPLTDAELAQIRTAYAALLARWNALPPGESLVLPFPLPVPAAGAKARRHGRGGG